MIIVMRKGCEKAEIAHAEQHLREMGFEPHTLHGVERTVIAAIGDDRVTSREHLETIPGVERAMPILAPYKLASRDGHPNPTEVRIGAAQAVVFGGTHVPVIAGPCSVEGRSAIIEAAHAIKEAGAAALRAGAFKPRTSPYSFQGLAEEGLEYLAEARDATGLPIVTEVISPEDVPLVSKYADVLQVGTRNMQNFLLLTACGSVDRPVLLKRGMAAQLEEYLLAAEYILKAGNPNVMLCERGIRTFESYVRNTFALALVPALKAHTHLPVLADPSHGTGVRGLVPPMTRAAVACGADGILIEVHVDPEKALTDGQQTLSVKEFASLMREIKAIAAALGRTA